MNLAIKFLPPLVWLVRLLVGAYPRWIGSVPSANQRIYFANHTSHMDTLVLWAALPHALRANTRPVAARDYWETGGVRQQIAREELNVVMIDRARENPAGGHRERSDRPHAVEVNPPCPAPRANAAFALCCVNEDSCA